MYNNNRDNSNRDNRNNYSRDRNQNNNNNRRSFGGYNNNRGNSNNRRSRYGNNNSRVDISRYVYEVSKVIESAEDNTVKSNFSDFNLEQSLIKNIESKGYTHPTSIQTESLKHIIDLEDVVGLAQTGTGKTGAFLIPLINKVIRDRSQKVIIIVPTRELAIQINSELFSFTRGLNIHSAVCIGGVDIRRQIYDIRKNIDFLIGTVGRIQDLSKRGVIRFENFNNVVLDEVDTMLDMGFVDDIKFIVGRLPKQRQSLFFSATINRLSEDIIHTFLDNPVTISVGETKDPSKNVNQDIIKFSKNNNENKLEVLHELLTKEGFRKVLIFSKTKRDTEFLSDTLNKRGFNVQCIHGDKSQSKREKALSLFKQNKINILVATDIASRGLDISDITHVINYDLPENYQDYIHRIGRTGRGEKIGNAVTFIPV